MTVANRPKMPRVFVRVLFEQMRRAVACGYTVVCEVSDRFDTYQIAVRRDGHVLKVRHVPILDVRARPEIEANEMKWWVDEVMATHTMTRRLLKVQTEYGVTQYYDPMQSPTDFVTTQTPRAKTVKKGTQTVTPVLGARHIDLDD